MKINNCIIIGSGPAGYSAAIYAARANLKPILFTGKEPGGQLTKTSYIENYPGFSNKIKGIDLMNNMKIQSKKFNTKIKEEFIIRVKLSKKTKKIHKIITENNEKLYTYGLIIATGATPKYLELDNEKKLLGNGVSTCATCDGFFYKNQKVAVIGGGDTALEESIYLSKICKKIYIIVRKNSFKASKIMQKRINEIKNIKIIFNNRVIKISGKKEIKNIYIKNDKENKKTKIKIKGLFIAIGHKPNSELFINQINLNSKGYIITEKTNTLTNIPGVFAAGDVQDYNYRQAITSSSTGCMAAMDLERYLSKIKI